MARIRKTPQAAAREAKAGWDDASDVWEDFEERGLDYSRDQVHGPALRNAVGNVRGLRVLDIGCGQGRFTRTVARRGARVCGIDWSDAMIASARRHERADPLGIEYHLRDARTVGTLWTPGTFDLVVACMSFMDMPGLPRVLRASHRLLRPGGRLVFSISHPLNSAEVGWERPESSDRGGMVVRDYFEEGLGITPWAMPRLKRPFQTVYWHRTFESWFALLHRTGFQVETFAEPRASAAQVRKQPLLEGCREVPFFLVLGCRKLPEPTKRLGPDPRPSRGARRS
jgi:2-polyprenyl-3-methyl-5-hydroxy-6-metoxy-1,4-benzoquinol methylase